MPFDWLFCNVESLIEIIQTDFKFFLDESLIQSMTSVIGRNCALNLRYDRGNQKRPFFNHKDPTKQEDLEYYKRCIARFRDLKNKDAKLFIIDEFGSMKYLYDNLVSTVDSCMPNMRIRAVEYSRDDSNTSINIIKQNEKHIFFNLKASRIMSGTSFQKKEDGEFLLQQIIAL